VSESRHPIEDPEVQAEVREWTRLILSRTGSGKVCVEFDFKDFKAQGTRLGGSTGRKKVAS
jgi:hypothetical protein